MGGNTNSPCTTYAKHFVAEMSYYYQNYHADVGYLSTFPDTLLRYGMNNKTEVSLAPPSYYYQNNPKSKGNSATMVGAKREFFYTDNQILTFAGIVSLPDGSANFGNADFGGQIAALYGYQPSDSIFLNLALEMLRVAQPRDDGGKRYTSALGRATLSYFPNDQYGLYGEIYGQNKTAFDQGYGINSDVGFLFLITPHIVFNFSFGQRIAGRLDAINQYYTAGFAFAF